MTPPRLSDRRFGLMIAAVLLVIAGGGWFFFDVVQRWLLVAGILFGLAALAAPGVLLPLNRLWCVLAERLGRAVNYVLLSLFFYLFVLPLGLVLRLLGHDPMQRGRDPDAKTYWTPVTRHTDETTLQDMF